MSRKPRSQAGLLAWLAEAGAPLFVVDRRRRVRFFNRGCVDLTGCPPGDVIGKVCDYTTDPLATLSQRILQALAPPPEVFAGQELLTSLQLIDAHGQLQRRQVHYLPLKNAADEIEVVLGLVIELPETPAQLQPTPAQLLHAELQQLLLAQAQANGPGSLIARSPAMQRVAAQLKLAQQSNSPVHFVGPAGAGKLYLARLLQTQSHRGVMLPPLVIQCRLLPRTEQRRLIKDIIAQHEGRKDPGGLILRDVEFLGDELQALLLEQRTSRRWPDALRLLTTSRISLAERVQQGEFLKDLFYQLTPLQISVPSLAERREDFDLLVQFWIEQQNRGREEQLTGVDRRTLDDLIAYHWTENVTELWAMLAETLPQVVGPVISTGDLPFRWQTGTQAQELIPTARSDFQPLEQTLETLERAEISRALELVQQNKARAAELLGLTRPKLYRRMEALGLLENGGTESKVPEEVAGRDTPAEQPEVPSEIAPPAPRPERDPP